MPDRGTVTWLHLSDLHLCEPHNGPDRYRVVSELFKDLALLRRKEGLDPDLLFVTGDLGYGNLGEDKRSLPSQYEEVQRFLEQVQTTLSIPRDRVFLVPGNHDVNRSMAHRAFGSWLNKDADLQMIEDMVTAADTQWDEFMKRLREYREFLHRYHYDHLLGDSKRLIYAQKCRVNDVDLAIAGLNSAWSCGHEGQDHIWMGGRRQIDHLLEQISGADVKIALMHHPTNWLRTEEATKFEQQLIRDFDFFLHGHEHLPFVDPRAHFVHIAAGAAYQQGDDVIDDNSYNVVRVDLNKGHGWVWVREFRDSRWKQYDVVPFALGPARSRQDLAAAICYRRTSAGVRFLLTLTSRKRWLFPKKKVVDDRGPIETALQAASEEAGAVGRIEPDRFTRFEYRNNDTVLLTDAYLFEVEELSELSSNQFERRPTWYTPEEAVQRVMKDRSPHEWWPFVTVLREAWARLEQS